MPWIWTVFSMQGGYNLIFHDPLSLCMCVSQQLGVSDKTDYPVRTDIKPSIVGACQS